MTRTRKITGIATFVLLGLLTLPTFAQTTPGGAAGGAGGGAAGGNGDGGGRQRGGNNGGNNGGGGGRFDPAEFRQRMMDNLKEKLGATDDEFKALEPQIEKVTTLQREQMTARFGGFGGGNRNRGGGNNGGNNGGAAGGAAPAAPATDANAIATKSKELQTLLDNKDAKPEEIKTKLDELRSAKAKAKDELTKAQTALRELLSQRQEAVLVTAGILD